MTRRKIFKYLGLGSLTLALSGFWAGRPHGKNPFYSGPLSDHFDGTIFYNPDGTPPAKLSELLAWQLNGQRASWPDHFESPFHGVIPNARHADASILITHVGHATFLIQTNGLNFLTDPVWAERASPVKFAGPKRVNPPAVDFENLPPIDVILLTHNHYDHMDMASLKRLVKDHDPLILTPLGNDTLVRAEIENANVQTADWDETVELANRTMVHFEPCHHWGARGMRDRRMTLWCAFTIETPSRKIHHIGDTGFHAGINFKKASDKHGEFDVAILPIGAYAPRWFMKGQHMNPAEAVEAFRLLNAKHAIGHHWGTFQLTDEPIEEPAKHLSEALIKEGVEPDRFVASRPGQIWKTT